MHSVRFWHQRHLHSSFTGSDGEGCSWSARHPRCWFCMCRCALRSRRCGSPGLEKSQGATNWPVIPAHLTEFLPPFLFLVLLMTAFMSFSHGTQDVYPTFLEVQVGLKPATVGLIGVLYGLGSIAGGFVFGALSEKWGRKRAIITAALLSIPVIPLWAYGHSAFTLGSWRRVDAVHGARRVGSGAGLSY